MNRLFAGRNLKDGEWLEKYVDSVIKRLHNKFDLVIIITGEVRVGKSTLGLFFLDQFYKKIGQKLDLDRFIAYASDEIEDKIFDLPTFTAMQIDETQESFDYSQHMSKDQYKMRVTFTTMSFKYRWIIVCGPDMIDIRLHFRRRAS